MPECVPKCYRVLLLLFYILLCGINDIIIEVALDINVYKNVIKKNVVKKYNIQIKRGCYIIRSLKSDLNDINNI